MNNKNERISFSELKTWSECSYKHKLIYIDDNKKFFGNEYTAFGTAIHLLCEKKVLDPTVDATKIFLDKFEEEISTVEVKSEKNVSEMRDQYKQISSDLLSNLSEYFGTYEVVEVEEQLFEPINIEFEGKIKYFKGFVDLILKTDDGKHHIIDWKSCTWGWDYRKKSDKLLSYQLMLYKKYYSEKHSIPLDKIETHFGLLKRTASKNSVELFRVSSGNRRMQNCLNLLSKAVKNIEKNCYIKNRLSCKYCEFYKTSLCT